MLVYSLLYSLFLAYLELFRYKKRMGEVNLNRVHRNYKSSFSNSNLIEEAQI